MRVKYFSSTQLHQPDYRWQKKLIIDRLAADTADVCVVAGDFCPNLICSIEAVATVAERMPVVYVPGNLDFYSNMETMESLLFKARERAAEIGNIHLLQNDSAVIGDTRFIGATMWTRVGDEATMANYMRISDFRAISTADGLWTIKRQNVEHDITLDFLENELSIADGLARVVVTHNSPHLTAFDPKYEGDPLNGFFATDMSHLLDGHLAPDLWVAGTSSVTMDWTVGATKIAANGLGHPRKGIPENENFDFDRVVEVLPRPSATVRPGVPGF